MAKSLKDQGNKVYTLSIGDTHFSLPASLAAEIENLPEASSHYGPAQGVAKLRGSIAEMYNGYTADSVIIVPGLKQGFFYVLEAIGGEARCCTGTELARISGYLYTCRMWILTY